MNVCHCQTQYCGAEWSVEEEKYEKKKKKKKRKKKKSEEKNLGRNYKTSRPTDGMPNYWHNENIQTGISFQNLSCKNLSKNFGAFLMIFVIWLSLHDSK